MELEAVLFEMAANSVQGLPLGFGEKANEIARQISGRMLFDIRLDDDSHYQRIAAIRYANSGIGALTLSLDGLSVRAFPISRINASVIQPLEKWANLPLREQVQTDIQGAARLFVAALEYRDDGALHSDRPAPQPGGRENSSRDAPFHRKPIP